jgi:hypothetical protein
MVFWPWFGLELEADVPNVKKDFIAVVTLCQQGPYGCLLRCSFPHLTPCSRALLEKLMVLHPVRKFPTFHGTQVSLLPSEFPILTEINPVHALA